MLDQFIAALEDGIEGRGPLAWSRSRDLMFPDASPDRRVSTEFRERYSNGMRQALLASARRIHQRLPPGGELLLGPSDVSDWFLVCAHAQTLYVKKRWSANPLQGTFSAGGASWLLAVQDAIAVATLDREPVYDEESRSARWPPRSDGPPPDAPVY